MAKKTAPQTDQFVELGSTGVPVWGGMIRDEYQPELVGAQGRKTYREMSNDPIVSAANGTIVQRLRSVPLKVQDGEDRSRELVDTALADMRLTWADTLTDILSMLPYGWSALEPVYKHRRGPDAEVPSRFNDGYVGWRSMPIRRQETLQKWDIDGAGEVTAMHQQIISGVAKSAIIPADRLLLFRTQSNRGNIEGLSIQRAAYIPWYCMKRVRVFEAIGIERELGGFPLLRVPLQVASDPNGATYQSYKKLGTEIRVDQRTCAIIPSDVYDGTTTRMYDFELISSSGSRKMDTTSALGRYAVEILMTMFCDFLMLGHQFHGSFAVRDSATNTFSIAIKGWLDSALEVLNRDAIPRLLRMNGWPVDNPPRIVAGDIETPDLAALGTYVAALAGAFPGMELVPNLLDSLLTAGGLPTSTGANEVGKRAGALLNRVGLDDVRELAESAKELQTALKAAKEKPERRTARKRAAAK